MPFGLYPPCSWCKHRHTDPRENRLDIYCDAFPNGVPLSIVTGHNMHTDAIEGDNGIQFELIDGAEEAFSEYRSERDQFIAAERRFESRAFH